MGGRGARFPYKGSAKTRAKIAVIPRAKLKNYLLNPSKDKDYKSSFFRSLGYNMKNWKLLERDIRKGLENSKPVFQKNNSNNETIYKVKMELGIDQKRQVRTIWAVKDKKGIMHFITAFPD